MDHGARIVSQGCGPLPFLHVESHAYRPGRIKDDGFRSPEQFFRAYLAELLGAMAHVTQEHMGYNSADAAVGVWSWTATGLKARRTRIAGLPCPISLMATPMQDFMDTFLNEAIESMDTLRKFHDFPSKEEAMALRSLQLRRQHASAKLADDQPAVTARLFIQCMEYLVRVQAPYWASRLEKFRALIAECPPQ